MEKRKLKKLMLKKETISNLSKFEQGVIMGGEVSKYYIDCVVSLFAWTLCDTEGCNSCTCPPPKDTRLDTDCYSMDTCPESKVGNSCETCG